MNSRLSIALALLVILGLGLFIGPMLIDWNRYRPEAEAWLAKETGRKITIAGDLKLRLLPQPRVTLTKLSVANEAGAAAPALMTTNALDARIAILPLFIGRVVVTSLRLDAPALAIERRPDGRFNLGFEDRGAPRVFYAGFALLPHHMAIDKIEITQGTLSYRDAALDYGETVSAIEAAGLVVEEGGPYRLKAGFTWAGQPFTLAVEAGALAQSGLRPLALMLEQTAAGLKASLTGRLGPGKSQAWQLGGALNVQLASPSAFGGGAAAWGNPAQNSAAPPLSLDGAVMADPAGASLRDCALHWGDFAAQGGIEAQFAPAPTLTINAQGGLLNLDAVRPDLAQASRVPYWPIGALQLFSATQAAASAAPPARGVGAIWQGTLALKLDALVFAQGRIASPGLTASFSNGVLDIEDLAAILPGDTELHIKGKTGVDGGFSGEAALAGERARELFLWAGVPVQPVEDGRLTRIAYKGGLDVAPGMMRLSNFEAGLDGSVAKGMLALSRPAASGPQIEADLQITRMNVDPYRALFGAGTAPLDAVLKFADATTGPVKLSIDTVLADGFEAHGLAADLTLSAAGGVVLKSLKLDDLLGAGLTLTGEGKTLSGAASVTLTGNSVGLDLRPLFARLGIAVPKGEAPLGPSAFDLKAEIKDGSGAMTAEGYLAGAKAGARLQLDKAEAPLAGRLGAGSLTVDAAAHGQNMVIPGRLLGYDPPIGKPGTAAEASGPIYENAAPAPGVPIIPPGWVWLTLHRGPEGAALKSGAGLTGGAVTLAYERKGDGASATYDLKLDGHAEDAAALLAALGVAEAKRKPFAGPVSLALAAQGPDNGVTITPASLALGGLQIQGDGKLDLSGAKPALTGALHGGAVDLDALLGLLPKSFHSDDVPGPWSEIPLDLSGLGRWDASLAVDAESVTLGHLPFAAPKFAAALKDGTLDLDDLHASLFGGPLTANIALRGGGVLPGLAASVKFIQIDGGALAKTLWGKDFVTAPFGGALSLTAQGASTAALAASAGGSLSLKSAAGTIGGIDPENAQAVTAFTDLSLDAKIENGVVTVSDGRMNSADGAAVISGGIALAPFTLSLAVKRDNKPGAVTLDGALDAPKRKAQQ